MSRTSRLSLALATTLATLTASAAWAAFPQDPPNDPRLTPAVCPDPNSEHPAGQWNLLNYDPGCSDAPHPAGISADEAWKVTTGDPDVVIAILDSGVDYDHEDLRNKIWLNRGELPVPQGP